MEKTEHHLLAGQQCWTLSATPSLGVLPRDVLSQMSPPQLHDFCIDLQGNRDEGAANLTQAHEDAKVRTVLAELLEALPQKKNEDAASPGLEMATSGKQTPLGQGLCNMQSEVQV